MISTQHLHKLHSQSKPLFGIMTAQHMIEHLIDTLQFSNGKQDTELYFTEEKAAKMKAYLIDSDNVISVGFKSPLLPTDALLPLKFSDFDLAKTALETELKDFHFYFNENPEAKPTNPTLGKLNYQEWIIFHQKHFKHHFKQFGLL